MSNSWRRGRARLLNAAPRPSSQRLLVPLVVHRLETRVTSQGGLAVPSYSEKTSSRLPLLPVFRFLVRRPVWTTGGPPQLCALPPEREFQRRFVLPGALSSVAVEGVTWPLPVSVLRSARETSVAQRVGDATLIRFARGDCASGAWGLLVRLSHRQANAETNQHRCTVPVAEVRWFTVEPHGVIAAEVRKTRVGVLAAEVRKCPSHASRLRFKEVIVAIGVAVKACLSAEVLIRLDSLFGGHTGGVCCFAAGGKGPPTASDASMRRNRTVPIMVPWYSALLGHQRHMRRCAMRE